MNAILTNLNKPLVSASINRGDITVEELKIWSGWRQHSGFIASYQWKSQPSVLRKIKIENDKVITFKVISEAFNTKLNKSSAGAIIASLSYKEGKVSLYLKHDTQLINVKIAGDIARELKIKPDRSNTGEPVDVDRIALHNVDNIFMTCEQAKSRTFIDNQEAEMVLTGTPFDAEIEILLSRRQIPRLFTLP